MTTKTLADGFKGEKAIVLPYSVREQQDRNAVTRQLHVTHIGYYPHAKYHYRERATGAAECILIYCEKGKGWVECCGEKHCLSAHQVFIIPQQEPHAYGSNLRDPWSIYWIHFKGENVRLFRSIIGKVVAIEDSTASRYNDRFMLFESMFQNLEMGYSADNLEYISFCLSYFLASIRYLPQYREIKNVKVEDLVQKIILFMKDNLDNRITLDDIAHFAGYSSSYLTTMFVQKTSYSLIDYYNQLRIQKACSYLQFSEMKIKEIAFTLGFYDPFHFSKSFRKEMGISPRDYRRKYREVRNPLYG